MKAKNFDLAAYFQRIDYHGSPAADAATLYEIMQKQLFSIPFENIDVRDGKGVSLVPEDIVEKLIGRQRGGYCYEVNALFAMALDALGVPYQFAAARPMFYPARRPRTHMVVIAFVGGRRWLCDLGFGHYGIRAPVDLAILDTEQRQSPDTFRLSLDSAGVYTLQARVDNGWHSQYSFDLSRHELIDFEPANYLNSTHPETIFVRQLVVVLHHPDGRSILSGRALKTIRGQETRQRMLSGDEIPQVLRDTFRVTAPEPAIFRAAKDRP
ncbi:acetyltransferase [Enterobacter sp. 10-1]|uniref:arylamine N-acetyltransferase family protein n=1 Tax=Raoultella sp. 10-1 TaxID=2683201 RepID=UPI000BA3AD3B|nr:MULTISPECIES: arylamine N-acetyltransferase [Enterobacteriaceae]MVT05114.1 arylamine N-acetyltransferase [Raoultella sp. 10-1]PAC09111.1 acetyltransferase [Enterobacter sp. 10-1]